MHIFGELRRRNIFKVCVGYTLLAWLLVKAFESLSPAIGAGDRAIHIFGLMLVLGFPVIVLFAWAYEITPDGLKPTSQVDRTQSMTRETGRRLNVIVLILIGLAALVAMVDQLF